MRRWGPTLRSGHRLEKRPTSLRPPDKPLQPQRLGACQGRMSPDAVWQYGCATKSAEPVSIQAPQHRATLSLRKRGPLRAAETALSWVQANRADTVGLLPSESTLDWPVVTQHRRCRPVVSWGRDAKLSLPSPLLLPLTYILFGLCRGKTAFCGEISMPVVRMCPLAVLEGKSHGWWNFQWKGQLSPCTTRIRRKGHFQT